MNFLGFFGSKVKSAEDTHSTSIGPLDKDKAKTSDLSDVTSIAQGQSDFKISDELAVNFSLSASGGLVPACITEADPSKLISSTIDVGSSPPETVMFENSVDAKGSQSSDLNNLRALPSHTSELDSSISHPSAIDHPKISTVSNSSSPITSSDPIDADSAAVQMNSITKSDDVVVSSTSLPECVSETTFVIDAHSVVNSNITSDSKQEQSFQERVIKDDLLISSSFPLLIESSDTAFLSTVDAIPSSKAVVESKSSDVPGTSVLKDLNINAISSQIENFELNEDSIIHPFTEKREDMSEANESVIEESIHMTWTEVHVTTTTATTSTEKEENLHNDDQVSHEPFFGNIHVNESPIDSSLAAVTKVEDHDSSPEKKESVDNKEDIETAKSMHESESTSTRSIAALDSDSDSELGKVSIPDDVKADYDDYNEDEDFMKSKTDDKTNDSHMPSDDDQDDDDASDSDSSSTSSSEDNDNNTKRIHGYNFKDINEVEYDIPTTTKTSFLDYLSSSKPAFAHSLEGHNLDNKKDNQEQEEDIEVAEDEDDDYYMEDNENEFALLATDIDEEIEASRTEMIQTSYTSTTNTTSISPIVSQVLTPPTTASPKVITPTNTFTSSGFLSTSVPASSLLHVTGSSIPASALIGTTGPSIPASALVGSSISTTQTVITRTSSPPKSRPISVSSLLPHSSGPPLMNAPPGMVTSPMNVMNKLASFAASSTSYATMPQITSSTLTTTTTTTSSTYPTRGERLPIDDHRDDIIKRIERDRVTIIHGETGCGKSSRLPVILLDHAESIGIECRMMISQPRRIAASSLMKRLRQTLGNKVGMRMGFGVKDETDDTQLHFVTTGYLVRLLAHHPEAFDQHTHLIIDEVHERSVDGDLLCLLARRLLKTNSTIKLILMSATIHTQLYKNYFSEEGIYYGDMECLSVGVRRFPIDIKYVEDMCSPLSHLSPNIMKLASEVLNSTKSCPNNMVPPNVIKQQYLLAFSMIKHLGQLGTGILVFVSGIADITDLTEKFEGLDKYKVIAIHSEIPFEEQETAFLPAEPNEIKVIIATNAAESSITLPDVDLVLCLGTHKALQYHSATHRVHLVNTWISKASATQRAGRTGRVRPGRVYRLYSKQLHDKFGEHEESEIHRTPLQDVILSLRSMLEDVADFNGVVPILEDLLEPPDVKNVKNSFDYLHDCNMITEASDDGDLTYIGRLAAQLPVDIQLGRLIAFGINLDVGVETVIIASALSQPKSLFRVASPLIHTDPDEMNDIVQTTILGALDLDATMYSEPMMHIKLFVEWNKLPTQQDQYDYARKRGLAYTRVKSFYSSTSHLLSRVKESLMPFVARLLTLDNLEIPNLYKQNMLRLILTWNNEDNILEALPIEVASEQAYYTAQIESQILHMNHVKPLFPKDVSWKLETNVKITYDGRFSDTTRTPFQLITTLINLSTSPIVWLTHEVAQDDKKKNVNVSLIIAAINEDSYMRHDTLVQEELIAFYKAFHSNFDSIVKAGSIISTNDFGDTYDIYLLSNPTKNEKRWWNEVHDELSKSCNMLIPVEGNAKIRDNNCCLTQNQLQTLFFGRPIDLSAIDENDKDMADYTKKKYKIASQIMSSKQSIVFSNPLESNILKTAKDSKGKSNNNKMNTSSSSISSSSDNLITDVPLGLRLLNAYRNIYKDKKLRLWKTPRVSGNYNNSNSNSGMNAMSETSSMTTKATSTTTATHLIPSQLIKSGKSLPPPAAVPGSAEWSKKRSESSTSLVATTSGGGHDSSLMKSNAGSSSGGNGVDTSGNNEDYYDDDEKIIVGIKAIMNNWIVMTNIGRNSSTYDRPPRAILSRQSPLSVTVHCGDGSLYAVAYNMVTIGTDARIVFVEGVSILPPGNRWITLALRCMGRNVSNVNPTIIHHEDEEEFDYDDEGNLLVREKKQKNRKLTKSSKKQNSSTSLTQLDVNKTISEEDILRCNKVYDLLQKVGRGPVSRAPGVISELEEIFFEYTGGTRYESEGGPMDRNAYNSSGNKRNSGRIVVKESSTTNRRDQESQGRQSKKDNNTSGSGNKDSRNTKESNKDKDSKRDRDRERESDRDRDRDRRNKGNDKEVEKNKNEEKSRSDSRKDKERERERERDREREKSGGGGAGGGKKSESTSNSKSNADKTNTSSTNMSKSKESSKPTTKDSGSSSQQKVESSKATASPIISSLMVEENDEILPSMKGQSSPNMSRDKMSRSKSESNSSTTTSKSKNDKESVRLKCPSCTATFSSPIYLYRHIDIEHKTSASPKGNTRKSSAETTSTNTGNNTPKGSSTNKKDIAEKSLPVESHTPRKSAREVTVTSDPVDTNNTTTKTSTNQSSGSTVTVTYENGYTYKLITRPGQPLEYKCDKCGKVLFNENSILNHFQSVHTKSLRAKREAVATTTTTTSIGKSSTSATTTTTAINSTISSSASTKPTTSSEEKAEKPASGDTTLDSKLMSALKAYTASTTDTTTSSSQSIGKGNDKSSKDEKSDQSKSKSNDQMRKEDRSNKKSSPSVNSEESQELKDSHFLCCSLYNSTRGCYLPSCTHAHVHPKPKSSQWEALRKQFKNLMRRSNYADLEPLPELQFRLSNKRNDDNSSGNCDNNNNTKDNKVIKESEKAIEK